MDIELTEKARIALDHLPRDERMRVDRLLSLLPGFPTNPALSSRVRKLEAIGGAHLFVGKAGRTYRLVFRQEKTKLIILEIAPHDRLNVYRGFRGGIN